MKSTPLELSNSLSHNSHTEFMSEVILMTSFSKKTSVTNMQMQKCQKTGKKLFFVYLQWTFNTYIFLRDSLNFIIVPFFHAYISLFVANVSFSNTCRFTRANTFQYKKSVGRVIARDWTWHFCRGIF